MITAVTTHLKNGDRVRMAGESIQIAASKKVAFRVAKELKEAV
jgi:nucleoid DNA-binding protein